MRKGTKYKVRGTSSRRGWTFVELVIAMGILAVLVALTTMNIFSAQFSTYESTQIDNLAADMALQQTRAMVGDAAASGTVTAYGIYFQPNNYIMFKGNSYTPGNADNVTVKLNPSFTFSTIGFPSSQIIYASGSGAFANYVSGQDTVVLQNTGSSNTQTLHVNSYGVLEQVQ